MGGMTYTNLISLKSFTICSQLVFLVNYPFKCPTLEQLRSIGPTHVKYEVIVLSELRSIGPALDIYEAIVLSELRS